MLNKNLVVLCLGLGMMNSALADMITCSAAGNTDGIVRLVAYADDQNSVQEIESQITVKTKSGETKPLALFASRGSLATGFKIAADSAGPFGIVSVSLVKLENAYAIKKSTYCNFYYQEENCREGDLLAEVIDNAIHCTLDN